MFHFNSLIPLKMKADVIKSQNEITDLGFSAAEHAADSFITYLDEYLSGYAVQNAGKFLSFKIPGYDDAVLVIDTSSYFNLKMTADNSNIAATESFVQALIFDLISSAGSNVHFRLCDRKNAGSGYGRALQVAHSDTKRYGGSIFSDDSSLTAQFNEIIKLIEERMVLIAGKYNSVFEYNKNEKNKLPILVLSVFYLGEVSKSTLDKFLYIQKNAEKGGVCIISVSDANLDFIEFTDDISVSHKLVTVNKPHEQYALEYISNEATDEDIKKFCEKKLVSSLSEDYFDLEKEVGALNSAECIHVPFAVDELGNVIEFEVGGNAPAHALLSGSTGSGKSVLLHTIIDSIILHYHPDDVEIWAIDYKAVEFACYVQRRTPHITVIGQDKSEDFSFSLLELINKEYERRKKLFLEEGVTSINKYRRTGKKLSRILIVIDEFHNLTQAVQMNQQYKLMLENLLAEMRAMGMSFLFSSQTISSGLQGLTEKGKNQIGCRICMKQTSLEEAKATLNESFSSSASLNDILSFGTGQAIYKKAEKNGFSYNLVRVLYISDTMRSKIMDIADSRIPADYKKRKEVICKDSNRYNILEKPEHSLNRFIRGEEMPVNDDGIFVYPAAPTSLDDEAVIRLDRAPGNNLLTVIEDNDLRESVMLYSIMSLLAEPSLQVHISLMDTQTAFSKNLKSKLDMMKADNLHVYYGGKESFDHIYTLDKLKPIMDGNRVEMFYGLQKMSSLIYMLNAESQDEQEEDHKEIPAEQKKPELLQEVSFKGKSDEEKIDALKNLKAKILANRAGSSAAMVKQEEKPVKKASEKREYKAEEVIGILSKLFEFGPDFGYFSILCFNNAKQFIQVDKKWLKLFEHRIGGMMSAEDSYSIFTTEYFVTKADEKTLVYFSGSSKNVKTLRPYLIMDKEYIEAFSDRVSKEDK